MKNEVEFSRGGYKLNNALVQAVGGNWFRVFGQEYLEHGRRAQTIIANVQLISADGYVVFSDAVKFRGIAARDAFVNNAIKCGAKGLM